MFEIKVYVSPRERQPVPDTTRIGTMAAQGMVSAQSASSASQAWQTTDAGAGRSAQSQRNEFLQLLTTQLKYQDPLEPMKDHEFIAQLAQFSTLEELQTLNQRMDLFAWVGGMGQAASFIGRTVTLQLEDGTRVEGVVDGVRVQNGVPYLEVKGRQYPMTALVHVR